MNLMNAASHGSAKNVEQLLIAGVPCDWQDPQGRTPLLSAVAHGHLEVVELLLAHGSNVNPSGSGPWRRYTFAYGSDFRQIAGCGAVVG